MENKELKVGSIVTAIRTFNNEQVSGYFNGYHYPTRKMKEKGFKVGVIITEERAYDVFPNSIKLLDNK